MKKTFFILFLLLISVEIYGQKIYISAASGTAITTNSGTVITPAVILGFKTEWVVSGDATARTITLPLYNSGTFNCTVDWGDGTALSIITAYNDADKVHTYATNGTYDVEIKGECPSWSFNNGGDKLKITKILNWGNSSVFGGFGYLAGGFSGCSNLTVPATDKILSKTTLAKLQYCFLACSSIVSINAGIFDNCIYLTGDLAFHYVFASCSNLTTLPTDLFRYNTAASTNAFSNAFAYCTKLATLPTDIFRYNVNVSTYGFFRTFIGCSALTSLPTDIFRYNINVSTSGFELTFQSCTKLASLPTDIFRYNTAVSTRGFNNTFAGCSLLASIPADLFRYNTSVSTDGFVSTFYACSKMTDRADMFYAAGEQSTRFYNRVSNFYSCLLIYSFTGTQGTAPDLWNCDFGSQTPGTGYCFSSHSSASVTNYADIPAAWK